MRPTSKELLQCEYIPPPQMEEAELNEILRSTISDPHSKSYRRMISAMFSQSVSLADDHIYDSDLQKVRTSKLLKAFAWVTIATVVICFVCLQFSVRFFRHQRWLQATTYVFTLLTITMQFLLATDQTKPYRDLMEIIRKPHSHAVIM